MTIERALELLPQMRDSEWITALGQKTALYTDEAKEAFNMAISALEKQEQANAQSVNSMRTSRPNALESLNILEQAKDDKGCVPMSLVRQAFRNVMEQDRWIPVTERMPEVGQSVVITVAGIYTAEGCLKDDGNWCQFRWSAEHKPAIVGAWQPLPEPYKAEEEA